jgi:hypothetical protein
MLKLTVHSVSHNCYRLGCYTSPYWFTPPPPTEIDWLISMVLQGRIAKKTVLLVFINNFYDWLFGIPFQPVIYCQNIWNILTFFTLSTISIFMKWNKIMPCVETTCLSLCLWLLSATKLFVRFSWTLLTLWGTFEFCRYRLRDSHSLLRCASEFTLYFPQFLTSLSEIKYTSLNNAIEQSGILWKLAQGNFYSAWGC